MQEKILQMLEMQNQMNLKVHPQWVEQHFEWYRAIWIECAELMDHHGWKWWKQQNPDAEQIKLELVDIWHFGLSLLIERRPINSESAQAIAEQLACADTAQDFLPAVEQFAAQTLQTKQFPVTEFASLLACFGMSFEDLYKAYIGKNVLNFFRQDHGYKEGSYIKVWQGREDNEHLVDIAAGLDVDDPGFKDQLYAGLQARYQALAG